MHTSLNPQLSYRVEYSISSALMWAAIAAVGAVLTLIGVAADSLAMRLIFKPIPILALIALLWPTVKDRYSRAVVVGLFFGLAGDILLELQGMFVPGLIAFLIGHLCYVVAFYSHARKPSRRLALPFVIFSSTYFLFLLPGLGKMTIPVGVYVAVITLMGWRAAARANETGADMAGILALVGAVFFIFSDSVIAFNRFYEPFAAARYLILPTYWLGQWFIGLSSYLRPQLRPFHYWNAG